MTEFIINNKTRVIGRRDDGVLIVTNHPSHSLSDIYENAVIIDTDGNILSPLLPIGSLTKFDTWYEENYYFISSNIVVDALLGSAVGDAFGVPVEFLDRIDIRSLNLKDMVTGMHNVPKGSWSDDTSMIVATMDSIINSSGDISYENIMHNYIKLVDEGEYTSTGYAFDVGSTITKALSNYKNTNDAFNSGCKEFMDNGNGSLMRILPFSLYCIMNNLSDEETKEIINNASSLTHAHDISKMGCFIYTEFLRSIIKTKNKINAFESILNKDYSCYNKDAQNAYKRLLDESFIEIKDEDINSTGYVVYTLESVIYSVLNTSNYEDSIITSVNLGNDTDTIACITGSITGVLYGVRDIPDRWLDVLLKKDYLVEIANKFNMALEKTGKVKKYE